MGKERTETCDQCRNQATAYDCDGYPVCAAHAVPCAGEHRYSPRHPDDERIAQYARHLHAGNPSRLG
jgi:hypothetical protein